MDTPTRIWWQLVVLVLLGAGLRVGLAIGLGLDKPPAFGSDQYEYDNYAWNVAQGRGYRGISPDVTDLDHLTAYRPPGTSLTWAALYRIFGHRYGVVHWPIAWQGPRRSYWSMASVDAALATPSGSWRQPSSQPIRPRSCIRPSSSPNLSRHSGSLLSSGHVSGSRTGQRGVARPWRAYCLAGVSSPDRISC